MNSNSLVNTNFNHTILSGVVFSFLLLFVSSIILISSNLILSMMLMFFLTIVLILSIKKHVEILIIAGVSSANFLILYFPVLGFVLSTINEVPLFELKVAVGIRSAIFSSLIVLFVVLVTINATEKKLARILLLLTTIFVLMFSFISSASSFVPKATYLINTFIPLFFTYIGILLLSHSPRVSISQSFIILALSIFCAFSLIYFLALELIYDIVRPDLISVVRSQDGLPLSYGDFPGSWGSMIAGFRFNRLVGTFPDPILFGYFMVMMAIFLFSKKAYRLSLFFLIIVFLSGSKGAWLLFLNTVFLFFILKKFNGLRFASVIGLVMLQVIFAALFQSSATIHLAGLQGAIGSILNGSLDQFLLGYGIGSGGNLARFSEDSASHGWLESGSESGVGILLYQLGLVGFLFYVFVIYLIDRRLNFNYKLYKDSSNLYSLAIIYSIFVNSFMQENCVNSSVLSILLFTVVLMLSKSKREKRVYAIS